MKARVKATGEIVDVYCDFREMKHDFLDKTGKGYMSNDLIIFDNEDYEQGWNDGYYEATSTNHDPDYWTRLEHQYAGMAMQGMSEKYLKEYRDYCAGFGDMDEDEAQGAMKDFANAMADVCSYFAQALVEKLKEKEERK